MHTAQRELAAFTRDFPGASLGEGARNVARQSLLDTLAVSFAGRHEPVVGRTEAYAKGMRQAGYTRTWLTGQAYGLETAALLNAVAAHAIDYDDVTPSWRGHPGAVIWPALCAVAQEEQASASFHALLDAFAIGFEVSAQLGANIISHHYSAGWHATATLGVIAGAAACARLLALDEDGAFNAIGLAAAQSAGLQASFGSMAKPMQAGFAASAAVRAATLAQAGVVSSAVLEGPNGFAALYGKRSSLELQLPGASGVRMAIEHRGIEVKQFSNCYAAHRAVEAALALRQELGARLSDVDTIEIEGTPDAHTPLLSGLPKSATEARFSVEYGVVCALLDGRLLLSAFTDAALRREDATRLMRLCRVSESAALGARRCARVTVHLRDGQKLQHTVVDLPGAFGEAAFMQRLKDKVSDCMSEGGVGQFAAPLYEAVLMGSPSQVGTPETWPVMNEIWNIG